MDGVRFSDVFWVSLAAFGGFELALAVNYLFLSPTSTKPGVCVRRFNELR